MGKPGSRAGKASVAIRWRRRLLAAGVAGPVIALVAVGLSLIAYPGFDHARQYLSELGGPASRAPLVFNLGIFAAGLMTLLAGPGFGLSLRALGAARAPAVLILVAFGLAGGGLMASSLAPWPDPRHHLLVNLGLGIALAPLFILWGLWRLAEFRRLKAFLGLVFVVMAALTWLTWPGLCPWAVTPANVGWWERSFSFVLVGWVAVTAIAIDRRLLVGESEGQAAHGASKRR